MRARSLLWACALLFACRRGTLTGDGGTGVISTDGGTTDIRPGDGRTSDAAVVERTRLLRNYGERAKYDHVLKGVNSRLDGLQAAFLSVKLRQLPRWNEARLSHADTYATELDGVGDLALQQRSSSSTHVYHLFIVETAERDAMRDFLTERGIQTGIHYPIPIHLQEAYQDLGLLPGAFPHAERLAQEALSLPMYPELSEEQIRSVTDAIREFFASGRAH